MNGFEKHENHSLQTNKNIANEMFMSDDEKIQGTEIIFIYIGISVNGYT